MNTAIANNLTPEEAARFLEFSMEPLPEDTRRHLSETALARSIETAETLRMHLEEAFKTIGAQEKERAQRIDEQMDLKEDLDTARANVKDQANRILQLHEQIAGANQRADRADRLADDLSDMLNDAQNTIRTLRAKLHTADQQNHLETAVQPLDYAKA